MFKQFHIVSFIKALPRLRRGLGQYPLIVIIVFISNLLLALCILSQFCHSLCILFVVKFKRSKLFL